MERIIRITLLLIMWPLFYLVNVKRNVFIYFIDVMDNMLEWYVKHLELARKENE